MFLLPSNDQFSTKNGHERIVVLNSIARRVVNEHRGQHPSSFSRIRAMGLYNMLNSAWRRARERAGLPGFRVHDLRHTMGHRLRAAGVSYEDRQDILGHKSDRITTHYSAPDVARLIEAAEKGVRATEHCLACNPSHDSHTIGYTKKAVVGTTLHK